MRLCKGGRLGVFVPCHLAVQLALGQLNVLTGTLAKGIQHTRILLHQTAAAIDKKTSFLLFAMPCQPGAFSGPQQHPSSPDCSSNTCKGHVSVACHALSLWCLQRTATASFCTRLQQQPVKKNSKTVCWQRHHASVHQTAEFKGPIFLCNSCWALLLHQEHNLMSAACHALSGSDVCTRHCTAAQQTTSCCLWEPPCQSQQAALSTLRTTRLLNIPQIMQRTVVAYS